jgi:hypothetical protein
MDSPPDIAVTIDVDWSPDWVIEEVTELLLRRGVKSTWFVTHASPAIERLRTRPDLFELGVHPNRLANSSHGTNDVEVLRYVKALVPEAVSMRTHGLYQTSAFLLAAARDFGIRIDSSLYLPASIAAVFDFSFDGVTLRRAPFSWADDVAIRACVPDWTLPADLTSAPGLKIFAFHPIHLVLNTIDYGVYEHLKTVAPLPQWDRALIEPRRFPGVGPRTVFEQLIAALAPGRPIQLKDLLPEQG